MFDYKVSVVVPCYFIDESFVALTKTCIEGLDRVNEVDEIIVVDDGSPLHPDLDVNHYLELPENRGYAGAVNAGLRQAMWNTIVICNNDIEFIQEDWLKHLLKPLKEGYDISSIRTTDSDGWKVEDYISEGDKFGSIWAMKSEVYETLGGLSQEYGKGYFEDLDYHRQAEDAGFKIAKNHAGLVEHKGKATFKVTDPDDTSYHESMDKFIQKWGERRL